MTLDKILIIALVVIPLIFFAVNYATDIRDYLVGETEEVEPVVRGSMDTAPKSGWE